MPTRQSAEVVLYGRWAALLQFVYQKIRVDPVDDSISPAITNQAVTPTGSTQLYNDPLGFALARLGYPATDPALVVDSDIYPPPVTESDGDVVTSRPDYFILLDLAEYRLIRNMVGNFTDVKETEFVRVVEYQTLADRAEKRADSLASTYPQYIGSNTGFVFAGARRHESWRDWRRP